MPQIIDACLYYNEDELWAGRIDTLTDVVDRFVVVEAALTHQSEPRTPQFKVDEWEARLGDRLSYHLMHPTPYPEGERGGVGSSFYQVIERQHRDATHAALNGGCSPDDVFLLSDVDEIPSADAVRMAADLIAAGEYGVEISGLMDAFQIGLRYPGRWLGTTACRVSQLGASLTPSRLRDLRGSGKLATVTDDNSWHLTWLGGPEAAVEKDRSYSHAEFGGRSAHEFARKIHDAEDSNGVPLMRVNVATDDRYPEFVLRGDLPSSWYREGAMV